MTVSSKQYEIIQDIYRERRRKAREDAEVRREEIARALPELAGLDEERRRLSMERLQASLDGNAGQAEACRIRLEQTDARKKELLASGGYTAADLEPRYVCPVCHDTGRDGTGDCACLERLIMERFYSASPLWNRTEEESFANLSLDWYDNKVTLPEFQGRTCRQVMEANAAAARDYVAHFAEKKDSLLLTGPVGTGKTFLCNCIAGALLKAGRTVLYLTAQEFFDAVEARLFDREEQEAGLSDQFGTAELLIIDDLGTEFTGRRLAANALFTVINERLLSGLATIISTNDDINELEEKYSAPVASRLVGCFKILFFAGQDIRIAKKLS